MSDAAKPETDSEKVNVAVNMPETGSPADVEITTEGRLTSLSIENCVAAELPLPAASSTAPKSRSTVTAPSADGVMSAV